MLILLNKAASLIQEYFDNCTFQLHIQHLIAFQLSIKNLLHALKLIFWQPPGDAKATGASSNMVELTAQT